jgi:ParB-like chromosome segregation protein Spo0J
MRVQTIPIEDIIIPPRRREDYGDLDALAANIQERGLFHPVVVAELEDGKFKLAAGERRLKACSEKLGWLEIPARIYDELSEDERLLIELEENLLRKDLTPFEQSKNLVALVGTAAKVIETEKIEFPSTMDEKSEAMPAEDARPSIGRPAKPVSKDRIAERVGVPRATIARAEQHVQAVESHPELKDLTQKEAIETARALDKPSTAKLKSIVTKASIPKPSKRSPIVQVQEFIYQVKSKGGALSLTKGLTEREQLNIRDEIATCRDELDSFVSELTDYFDEQAAIAS